MRMIDAESIHEICNFVDLVDAIDGYHREPKVDIKDMLMTCENIATDNDHFLVRGAWSHGMALGIKAATVFPANVEQTSLPAIHAVFVLYEGECGVPAAVMDGTALTYYKTAADSALGAKYLARSDVQSMSMIGAGAMAPYLIKAHCAIRPSIETVTIWNRTASRADTLAEALAVENVEIRTVSDIELAVRDADLISSATMTQESIIKGEWLAPGSHLDLIGAFTPTMRETDDVAMQKSRIFVDSRATTIGEIGEIIIPMQNGTISESDILGDFYDLCPGRVGGRESDQEITLFKNGGGGHLDLMTARYINSRI